MARKSSKSKTSPKEVVKKVPRPAQTETGSSAMAKLLAQTGYVFKPLSQGQIVEGKVTAVTSQAVYIDVGAKSEGIVSGKEFDLVKDFIKTLSAGDRVKVYVRQPEDDQGNIVLSLRKAASDAVWRKMEVLFQSKEPIKVLGIETNKGGAIVQVDDLHGFIPSSQLLPELVGNERGLVNTQILAQVIEVDRSKNRLVLAQRRQLTAEEEKKRQKIWAKLKIGQKVAGEVLTLVAYGAVVTLENGLDAFLHISEIAWEKIERPEDRLAVGQKIKVVVAGKGESPDRIQVSLKQLEKDPWDEVVAKYQEGQTITGVITRKAAYGYFVELEPGIEGLIYISKLTTKHDFEAGGKVKCFVDSLDVANRRISLSVVPEEVPVIYK